MDVWSVTRDELAPAGQTYLGTTVWEYEVRTTFTIELKMDVADEEQMTLMHEVLKNNAQLLFAQSVLLAGKRPPMIALKSENSFAGQTEIELHENTQS